MASSRPLDRATSQELMQRLDLDAALLARRFNLEFKSIQAERANVKNRFGVCYSDGAIKIRLRHSVSGRPLKYSSLVNTLCHELAHLRHFNHGERFRAFYQRILEFAREQGIYCPATRGAGAEPSGGVASRVPSPKREAGTQEHEPVQLALFG